MGKIFTAEQIRRLDRFTIENEPVSSIGLMERASLAFANALVPLLSKNQRLLIVAGSGNNGGDALAVSRILSQKKYRVSTLFIPSPKVSPDCAINLQRACGVVNIDCPNILDQYREHDVIVDGILGTGISRPPEGIQAEIIKKINAMNALRVSIDVPSGLFVDQPTLHGCVIRAHHTLTFDSPKLSFLIPENQAFVGNWLTVPIGLSAAGKSQLDTPFYYLDASDVKPLLPKRPKFSHKGMFGKSLIISGSKSMIGASVLACKGALRSGCGTVTALVPQCGYDILQSCLPEAMCLTSEDHRTIGGLPKDLASYDAVLIGPGIGRSGKAAKSLRSALKLQKPLVLDADALNLMAERAEWFELLPAMCILTPHPGEFKRMVGNWKNDFEKLEKLQEFSIKHQVIVVLKGAHSAICDQNGNIFFNSTGNSSMAIPGSGDVLAGILVALLARGMAPIEAAKAGVFHHGLAGDLARQRNPNRFLMAGELADCLSLAEYED